MLIKIVLDTQIKLFDCKQTLTLELIHGFVRSNFSKLKNYTLYYLDNDGDQIILQSSYDLEVCLESSKKPKIHIQLCEDSVGSFINYIDDYSETKSVQIQPLQKEKEQVEPKFEVKAGEEILSQNQKKEKVEELEVKDEVRIEKEKKYQKLEEKLEEGQVHEASCDNCKVEHIRGIRYKCGFCHNYDLCSLCQSKNTHNHPLIKIRTTNQTPLSCRMRFNEAFMKQNEKLMKGAKGNQSEQIKSESRQEKQQMILSYLENLLGEDQGGNYATFAGICRSKYYDDIFDDYIQWLESKNETMPRIFKWIGKLGERVFGKFNIENHP